MPEVFDQANNSFLRKFNPGYKIAVILDKTFPNISAKDITKAGVYFVAAACALRGILENTKFKNKITNLVGGLFGLAGSCDFIDGAMARLKGTVSNDSTIDDLGADRLQELMVSTTKSLLAIKRKDKVGLIASILSGLTSPLPSYFRAQIEELGYHPSESTKNPLGTRPGRFLIGAITTTMPDAKVNGRVPLQPVLDTVSAVSNTISAVERDRVLKRAKRGGHKGNEDVRVKELGRIKSDYLTKFIIVNTLILSAIGVVGLMNVKQNKNRKR